MSEKKKGVDELDCFGSFYWHEREFCLLNPITLKGLSQGESLPPPDQAFAICLDLSFLHLYAIQTGRENVKATDTLLNEKCSGEVRNKISGLLKVVWLLPVQQIRQPYKGHCVSSYYISDLSKYIVSLQVVSRQELVECFIVIDIHC